MFAATRLYNIERGTGGSPMDRKVVFLGITLLVSGCFIADRPTTGDADGFHLNAGRGRPHRIRKQLREMSYVHVARTQG